ncbi:MAG: hypothetical protein JSW27_12850 [Phycisphaerales bacterium]|nr:MAG: hypothetical protein JSW27_12850 [Phycisphaerales bacterium]
MSVRSRRLFALTLCSVTLALGGCCSRCGSRCTPQGPWQSPTIQATRALMVVNTEELRILRMDGRNIRPSCIGAGGVREYHIPAGTHAITASFRYAARVSGGLIGAVSGVPVTQRHQFVAGHEYVPVYREHARPEKARGDRTWSLDVVDLAQARPNPEPEVREARRYCAAIRNEMAAADPPGAAHTY